MEKKLWICGLGVNPPLETTLEALQAFDASKVVFTDLRDEKVAAWLKGYCRKLKRRAGAAEIVRAARAGGPVALAVWGHPQFNSALAIEVERRAREAKLGYEVLGAISPIGSAFARSISFLGGDYGYQGIQSYPLETLLAEPGLSTARLPLVAYAESATPARWKKLFAALARDYPAGHAARLYPSGSAGEIFAPLAKLSVPAGAAVLLVPPAPGGEDSR